MHKKQDAAEIESTSEGHHDESVMETRSNVRQGSQSNSQDGSQNGYGKCGKHVVKGDICDLFKKLFHFKCAGRTKEKFRMPVFSDVKCAKRSVANVRITASIKQEQRKR